MILPASNSTSLETPELWSSPFIHKVFLFIINATVRAVPAQGTGAYHHEEQIRNFHIGNCPV